MNPSEKRDVVLIQMPDCFLTPSLALSILKRGLAEEGISCHVEYASHMFIRHLGYARYHYGETALGYIAARGWEFLFAPFTGFEPAVSEEVLYQGVLQELIVGGRDLQTARRLIQSIREIVREIREEIPAFLEAEARRILSFHPRIAGFSIMTQQRNASFAMCRVLKEMCPEIITILGGGVCVGEAAKQFLRATPHLDYVFTGEGDRGLARACRALLENGRVEAEAFPYMLRRGMEPFYLLQEDMDDVPTPDFRDYCEMLKGDDFAGEIRMHVPMEASRGCWWAMRHRCRFCGLHYCRESAVYRQKSPEKFWKDLEQVHRESGFTIFMLADCILSARLIRALPEKCPEDRKKFLFFAECRTDLGPEELRRLSENGFRYLQPGIESLQDDLLKLMNKGRTSLDQVLFLTRCVRFGISPTWNIIFGIPGEEDAWYEEMFLLMRKIHHLPPPMNAWPMLLARGSEFQTGAEKYGVRYGIRLSEYASSPGDPAFLESTADYYTVSARIISPATIRKLFGEYRSWRKDYDAGASLAFSGRTEVEDRRQPDCPRTLTLTQNQGDILRSADGITEISTLSEGSETDLLTLEEMGLIFRKGDRIVSLVCSREGA